MEISELIKLVSNKQKTVADLGCSVLARVARMYHENPRELGRLREPWCPTGSYPGGQRSVDKEFASLSFATNNTSDMVTTVTSKVPWAT